MIKKAQNNNRGFTLIETILVIIVLGIAASSVLMVFVSGLRESAYPLQGVQAVELAKEKLEIIMADKHNATRGYAYLTTVNYPNESPVTGFTEFNRAVSFQDVDASDLSTASPGSGYRRITVTVSWGGESVTLVTLAADY